MLISEGDTAVMKKLDLGQDMRELKAIFERIDRRIEKYGEMTKEEIDQIVHEYRAKLGYRGKVLFNRLYVVSFMDF